MIYDSVKNLKRYADIIPHYQEIQALLDSREYENMAAGNYVLQEDQLKLMVQNVVTQPAEVRPWESHCEWGDIQIPLSGVEVMGSVYPQQALAVTKAVPENDTWFYAETDTGVNLIKVHPGEFVVFFPGEYHKPCCQNETSEALRKIIVKFK